MDFLDPADAGYQRAKRVRQGRATNKRAFGRFISAFEEAFGVAPLYVAADVLSPGGTPRLVVVLERSSDFHSFDNGGYAFDPARQRATVKLFFRNVRPWRRRRLFGRGLSQNRVTPASLLVCFNDFESVAKQDAHGSVTDSEREQFEAGLGLGDRLWCTQRLFGAPIVFVHTAEQARELEQSGACDVWADDYFDIVKRHDEFGYLVRGEIMIGVDSKENLDTNYEGNFYYYFK